MFLAAGVFHIRWCTGIIRCGARKASHGLHQRVDKGPSSPRSVHKDGERTRPESNGTADGWTDCTSWFTRLVGSKIRIWVTDSVGTGGLSIGGAQDVRFPQGTKFDGTDTNFLL